MSTSRGTVQIGSWRFPPPEDAQGVALLKWASSAKLDKKPTDGKNDARTTFKGRETGEVKITLKWKDIDATGAATKIDDYATRMLADLSPRGPNAGTPYELVAKDQEIHAAHNVIAEKLEGPDRAPGVEATAILSCSTWTKDTSKPVVAKTPDAAKAWSGKRGSVPGLNLPKGTRFDPAPTKLVAEDGGGGFADPATAPRIKP